MSTMIWTDLLKQEFPSIDDGIIQKIQGVLSSGMDDFESSEDLYDAIGAILHKVANQKSENDIKDLCEQLLRLMKPTDQKRSDLSTVLDTPVSLNEMAANAETEQIDVSTKQLCNNMLNWRRFAVKRLDITVVKTAKRQNVLRL